MTDWREVVLGDVIELKRGYDLPNAARRPGPVPIISSSGVSGFHAEAKVSGPGVVTGRYGTLGQVFYVDQDFWPLNTSLYVRDFKGNDRRFVAALLESMDLAQHDGAAAVPGLNRNQLHTLPVRVPDVDVQQRIACVLQSIDDLIANNRRRVELLDDMARAIYREWFVRFRYPRHENVSLVDSPLGPVPGDWTVAVAGELQANGTLEIGDGYRAKNAEMLEDGTGLPFVRVANVRDGYLDLQAVDHLPAKYSVRLRSKVSRAGDVVISMKGTVGRQALVDERHPSMAYSPQVSFWRSLDTKRLPPVLLYEWIRSESFVRQCAASKGATDMADYVNLGDQRRMRLLLPPEPLAMAFTDRVAPMVELASDLRWGIERLGQMRDLLLPKLVSGAIDVSSLDLELAGATA